MIFRFPKALRNIPPAMLGAVCIFSFLGDALAGASFAEASDEVRALIQLERATVDGLRREISEKRSVLHSALAKTQRESERLEVEMEGIGRRIQELSNKSTDIDEIRHNHEQKLERISESLKFSLTEFAVLYRVAFPHRTQLEDLITPAVKSIAG